MLTPGVIRWKYRLSQGEEIIMEGSKEILKKALGLSPSEKAELIDKLLSSIEKPDSDLDELWAKEAENRIDAYEKGQLRALSIKEVLDKYR